MVTPLNTEEPMIASTIYLDGDMLNEINGYNAIRFFENNPAILQQHFDKLNGFNNKLNLLILSIRYLLTVIITTIFTIYSINNIEGSFWKIIIPPAIFGLSYLTRNFTSKKLFWLISKLAFKSFS